MLGTQADLSPQAVSVPDGKPATSLTVVLPSFLAIRRMCERGQLRIPPNLSNCRSKHGAATRLRPASVASRFSGQQQPSSRHIRVLQASSDLFPADADKSQARL